MERKIIEHCAPTLAGLKTANLFNYEYFSEEKLEEELQGANETLNKKGVYVENLKLRGNRALLYVYRRNALQNDLHTKGAKELLRGYGYREGKIEEHLEHLKERLQKYDCFPHEIGLFLGYPLEDVVGFIRQGGKNCKCSGIWKVYGNEGETLQLFARFKKCTDVYKKVFARGRTLSQLTVAA